MTYDPSKMTHEERIAKLEQRANDISALLVRIAHILGRMAGFSEEQIDQLILDATRDSMSKGQE